jgi:hypothetical protein
MTESAGAPGPPSGAPAASPAGRVDFFVSHAGPDSDWAEWVAELGNIEALALRGTLHAAAALRDLEMVKRMSPQTARRPDIAAALARVQTLTGHGEYRHLSE